MAKFPKRLSRNRVKILDCGFTLSFKDDLYVLKLEGETFSFKTLYDAEQTYGAFLYTKNKMLLIEQSFCCSVNTSSIKYLPIYSVCNYLNDVVLIYLIDKNVFIKYDREAISINDVVIPFNTDNSEISEEIARNMPKFVTLEDKELNVLVRSLWRRINDIRS